MKHIYSTPNYFICLTDLYDKADPEDGQYQLVNKQTSAIEFAHRAYPACLEMALRFEHNMKGFYAEIAKLTAEGAESGNVVPLFPSKHTIRDAYDDVEIDL